MPPPPYLADGTDWRSRITMAPGVLAGKPAIRGLPIGVEQLLRTLARGQPFQDILKDHPELEAADLAACLAYAAECVSASPVSPQPADAPFVRPIPGAETPVPSPSPSVDEKPLTIIAESLTLP